MDPTFDPLTLPVSELPTHSKIQVTIMPDREALFRHFARSIAAEIQANNQAGRPTRLILPVGPVGQYPLLAEICNREHISWQNVHTFNMDEYCDWQGRLLPRDHPLSFRRFMDQSFFNRLDSNLHLSTDQIHFPDPLDLDRIRQEITAVGGIDTCYGGVGYHGHVAFNEPPISRWYQVTVEAFKASLPRVVALAPDTVVMNSIRNTGGNPTNFPAMGVTLGMGDILAARRIRMYCAGGMWQRYVARMAMFAGETVDYPVTLLQGHPDYELILDQDTASPPEVSLS
jgi:glucosamine-6-phosphate deaminase